MRVPSGCTNSCGAGSALIACARAVGYETLEGAVLATNRPMLTLTEHLGFVSEPGNDSNHTVNVVLSLNQQHAKN